ncbi:uncharacterized protein TNCV_3743031 [Trichonephila clavipes]|nr:uncharacterized protein TNCV_3743031 [Trichonephila clavipes]
MAEDDDWLSNLLWTDKAHFTLRGSVNTHNCRIWATENPSLELSWKLHCTTRKSRYGLDLPHLPLSGLFFIFEELRDSGFVTATVTGERYAYMLQNRIIPSQADKHLLERTIFMQDGAPPHIARRVKDLLRAGRLVMIVCSAATLIMLGLPGPQISVRAIIGFGVT